MCVHMCVCRIQSHHTESGVCVFVFILHMCGRLAAFVALQT